MRLGIIGILELQPLPRLYKNTQATPPKKPITFEYIARFFAHNLIHLNEVRKFSMFGTSRSISSVTLEPFKDRTHRSSRVFSKLSSDKSNSSWIVGRANLANVRSMGIP